MRATRLLYATLVSLAWASTPSFAVMPDEVLPDPALEHRARAISAGLRCLVCQNQSIDDSEAPLARDLRLLVRERLKAGDSDADVRAFVVARYGDFVLLQPPVTWHTLALWVTPLAVLLLALAVAARGITRMRATGEPGQGTSALTDTEEKSLKTILERGDDKLKR
jgi:cytochrome c-type biogenesis protein CcmH